MLDSKSLLFGVAGIILGGLIVSTAANLEKNNSVTPASSHSMSASMNDMEGALKSKTSDAYDKAFIENMIEHHNGAILMAMRTAEQGKHQELKTLSEQIIQAQEREIIQMQVWYKRWGYGEPPSVNLPPGKYPGHRNE